MAQAYGSRGSLYHKQGKLELALADYNQTIVLDDNELNVFALNNIGLIEYETGAIEEAQQKFSKVIESNREFAEPRLAYATTLFISGETDKALVMAEEALRLDKQFADSEYLKKNLWGNKLIADTEKLLAHPQIHSKSQ